jgi:hypothetical protein
MSQTFSIICRETRQRVWVGQGWGTMTSFYSGEAYIQRLKAFLNATRGKALEFVCNDANDEIYEFDEFGEPASDTDASQDTRRSNATGN